MTVLPIIRNAWPLLASMGLIMLGNGLQGSLLSLRATSEGFSTFATGFVMTGYFAGFLIGSVLVPVMVRQVGHVRVFAALGSLASAAVLLHLTLIEPGIWFIMRLVTGVCYAGLYVVCESWLNEVSTRETRGQVLSAYMVVLLGGMAGGQLFLNLGDPMSFELFLLISVLISLAVLPIALTPIRTPALETPERLSLRELFRISPLGVLGTIAVNLANAQMFGMGAVYAQSAGLDTAGVSYFMFAIPFGAVLLQWPIGYLSDKMDRRHVICLVAAVASLASFVAIPVGAESLTGLLLLAAVLGGCSIPLYAICIAYTNDHLDPKQVLAASSSLVLFSGIGLVFGPVSVALAMRAAGPEGFLWSVGLVHGAIAVYALYRMTQRPAPPLEEQRQYDALPPRMSPVAASVTYEGVSAESGQPLKRWSR